MARLRLVFALLALAILAATGLLARRALRASEVERAARHETLAARLYDEMEGALSGFLRREEERPIGQYEFSALAEGGGRVRSPLSRLADDPDAPFVVGWFQIDPDGRVRSPLVPADAEPASGAPPEPLARETAARVCGIVEQALGASPALAKLAAVRDTARRLDAPRAGPAPQAPKKDEAAAPAAEAKGAAPEAKTQTAYDVLQSLNRGSLERQKERKVLEADAPEGAGQVAIAEAHPAPPSAGGEAPAETFDAVKPEPPAREGERASPQALTDAAVEERVLGRADAFAEKPAAEGEAAPAPAGALSSPSHSGVARAEPPAAEGNAGVQPGVPTRTSPAEEGAAPPRGQEPPRGRAQPNLAPPGGAAPEPAATPRDATPAAPREPRAGAERSAPTAPAVPPPAPPRGTLVRIAVDPFAGQLAGEHLLLVRTVLVGERGYQQGMVIDVARLAAWLRARALDRATLPGAELRFVPGGSFRIGALGPRPFHSQHPFAEPFDALRAELALEPLPEGGGEQAVLALAALLVIAAAGGLFALYRMVTVRLAFAQRRSNFAAAVSHELKTPLTAIRMYVEMLRDGLVPSEEKRREYYATLGAESERLSRLIDNVLEFSRLERGTRKLDARAAPLGPAVEDVVALLRPHAERQGFRLDTAIDPALPAVRFERDALAQILFNLVENALKYARGASNRGVVVSCRPEAAGVALSVRDRGPGVPERRLARVFEPFYRGEDELTRETQGSGIGLALVRGLAERMGADVEAHNAQGGGLEVTLRFPAAPAAG